MRVDIVVSDHHLRLVNAIKRHLQGALWQRCQCHFIRNILAHAPRHCRADMANQLKLIFHTADKATAKKLAADFIVQFDTKAQKAVEIFEEGFEQALTVLIFPERYRQKLRTTNLPERMNEEIRRRQRVIRISLNDQAAMRLIGALLADQYETWQNQNRYLDMADYWDWKNKLAKGEDINSSNIISITK